MCSSLPLEILNFHYFPSPFFCSLSADYTESEFAEKQVYQGLNSIILSKAHSPPVLQNPNLFPPRLNLNPSLSINKMQTNFPASHSASPEDTSYLQFLECCPDMESIWSLMWWILPNKTRSRRTQEIVSWIRLNFCFQECYQNKDPVKEENTSHKSWHEVERS